MDGVNKNLINGTYNSWENDVIRSELPIADDFWADCGRPCRMAGPIIEQISQDMNGKARFAKLNVDENQEIAMKYQIKSIPSINFYER